MRLDFEIDKPIFQQIADEIEDAVFTGAFGEEGQIPSTTEISVSFKINPATVLKGMNVLVDKGIIYKKRGVGMFVCTGAKDKIKEERQTQFFQNYIANLIQEAGKLGLSKEEILSMIERGYGNA